MFLLAIGAVISTSDRYKRQNKPSKLATNLSVAMHALSALMAGKLQLPSVAVSSHNTPVSFILYCRSFEFFDVWDRKNS